MASPSLAREIVTAIAAGQAIAPLLIDLNRTHATHPLWPGHARFHVVWQSFSEFLLGAAAVVLLWWPGLALPHRFYMAAVLTAIPLGGFSIALFARRLYGGTLHDPAGIPPVRIPLAGRVFEVDGNAAVVGLAAVMLGIAVLIF